MLQAILVGLLCIAIGAVSFFKPEWVWKISEGWKTYGGDGPTDLYRSITRVCGVAFMAFGVFAIVLSFFLK